MKLFLYNRLTTQKERLGLTQELPVPQVGSMAYGRVLRGEVKSIVYHYDHEEVHIMIENT